MVIFQSFENFCGFLFFALIFNGIVAVLLYVILNFMAEKMESVNMDEYEELYKTNSDFKDYVDRYMRNKNITISEALKMKIIRMVGDMYKTDPEEVR